MSNYSKITKHGIENINDEDFFEGMSNVNRELFKRALSEAMDSKIHMIEEKIKDKELTPPSRRHKLRMNRLFREHVGSSFVPFPDEDDFY